MIGREGREFHASRPCLLPARCRPELLGSFRCWLSARFRFAGNIPLPTQVFVVPSGTAYPCDWEHHDANSGALPVSSLPADRGCRAREALIGNQDSSCSGMRPSLAIDTAAGTTMKIVSPSQNQPNREASKLRLCFAGFSILCHGTIVPRHP